MWIYGPDRGDTVGSRLEADRKVLAEDLRDFLKLAVGSTTGHHVLALEEDAGFAIAKVYHLHWLEVLDTDITFAVENLGMAVELLHNLPPLPCIPAPKNTRDAYAIRNNEADGYKAKLDNALEKSSYGVARGITALLGCTNRRLAKGGAAGEEHQNEQAVEHSPPMQLHHLLS